MGTAAMKILPKCLPKLRWRRGCPCLLDKPRPSFKGKEVKSSTMGRVIGRVAMKRKGGEVTPFVNKNGIAKRPGTWYSIRYFPGGGLLCSFRIKVPVIIYLFYYSLGSIQPLNAP